MTTSAKIEAGGFTGWHSHPGPVFVTATKGTLTVYNAPKCEPEVYPAGTGFVEASPKIVHRVRHEGTGDAEFAATFILPVGAVRRIDEPQPTAANCPVL